MYKINFSLFSNYIILISIIIVIINFFLVKYLVPNERLSLLQTKHEKAESFLVRYIGYHQTTNRKLINSKGQAVEFSPYEHRDLYRARDVLDSLMQYHALVNITEEDVRKVSEDYLLKHTERALDTWQKQPFNNHVEFNNFCNYILPYRAGNEKLSDYHKIIQETFLDALDKTPKLKSPKQAVSIINNELKKRLVFDLRSHADLISPSMPEVLKQGKGSCASLTQFTALTMRTAGLAVAIDECPVWAHRNSGHQWNAFLDSNGEWVPFGGAETNPDEFQTINDSVKAPKIYRHTYSVQNDFGPPVEDFKNIPAVFHQKNRIDVTADYVGTSDVTIALENNIEGSNGILYLAVFNAEQWRIVSWARIKNGKATFPQMGNNHIIYLPVFYVNGKKIPASSPFLLSPNNKKTINADHESKKDIELKYYNRFYDIKWNIGVPKEAWKMELFYWEDKWVTIGNHMVGNDSLLRYDQVPTEGLYLIKSHDWQNTWQRVFTIKDGRQVWY